jgi:CheY-like chemotaxis protein
MHAPAAILQVEDDENDVLLMRYALSAAGVRHPLIHVQDGQEAIDYLAGEGEFQDRIRHPFPCMILLDINLPRRSGLDVIQWIRSRPELRSLVVIVFSASAVQREVDQAYASGANSFLIKPAGLEELTGMLRTVHAYWMGWNRFGSVPLV